MTARRYRIAWPLVLLAAILLGGTIAPLANEAHLESQLQRPRLDHWMGTDYLGRDVALRSVHAASLSLGVAALAWLVSLLVGLAIGTYVGVTPHSDPRGRTARFAITVIYSTPFLIVLVGVVSVLGSGIVPAYLGLVLIAWAAPARHTSAIVEEVRQSTTVLAGRSFGFGSSKMIRFILVPEVFRPVLTGALAALPELLTLDVALSFFGLGAEPPTPTLGGLILEGLTYFSIGAWMAYGPLAFLVILCLTLRSLSETLRVLP